MIIYNKLELLVKKKVNNFELPTTTKIEFEKKMLK